MSLNECIGVWNMYKQVPNHWMDNPPVFCAAHEGQNALVPYKMAQLLTNDVKATTQAAGGGAKAGCSASGDD